jgi:Skp family chaperone for outer membrane proteins
MHKIIFAATLALTSLSVANAGKNKDISFFLAESERLAQSSEKETDLKKRYKPLQTLKKSLESELKKYKKENPQEGSDEEQAVSRFFYTLEPAFELISKKKITEEDCARAVKSVERDDSIGRPEGTKRSLEALAALKWLSLLCQ